MAQCEPLFETFDGTASDGAGGGGGGGGNGALIFKIIY